jgi:DNA processing protein
MADSELRYRIALTMIPSVGPVTARALINTYGTAGAVFSENPDTLRSLGKTGEMLAGSIRSAALLKQADREMEFLERYRIRALWFQEKEFPGRLNHCHDGPVLIYVRGNQDLNVKKCLSVVGTRRATGYGIDQCRSIIRDLAELVPGLVIISGLAFGIDVTAHRAALDFGLPTVAVLGHGLATVYPTRHRETARRIAGQGALVTDFDFAMRPERNHFLRRNRIIAGMSDATLVVESPSRGGALVTADIAFSYQRTVLAVPGRTIDLRSGGCNRLIKTDTAALTETAADVIRHLNWEPAGIPQKKHEPSLFPAEEIQVRVLLESLLENPGSTPENLCQRTGMPVREVLVTLLELEMKGTVACSPGNLYRITPRR